MTHAPIATIDGPSSSGKGTISRIVAARVGWHLLDSGALYRLVALGGLQRGLDPDDVEQHVSVARSMRVQFGAVADGPGLFAAMLVLLAQAYLGDDAELDEADALAADEESEADTLDLESVSSEESCDLGAVTAMLVTLPLVS